MSKFLVVRVQRLQVVYDVYAALKVVDPAKVHLDATAHRLPRILHVVHQMSGGPHKACGPPVQRRLRTDIICLAAGATVYVEERGAEQWGPRPHYAPVRVDGVALRTMLFEEFLPLARIARGQLEIGRLEDVSEVAPRPEAARGRASGTVDAAAATRIASEKF